MGTKELKKLNPEDQRYAASLVQMYGGTVRRIARSYLGCEYQDEVEDVVQETFAAICNQLDDFRTYDSPEALVVRITSRKALRVRKKHRNLVPLNEDYPAPDCLDLGLDEILPASTSKKDKDALYRAYECGDTAVEIAEDLSIESAAVRQRL